MATYYVHCSNHGRVSGDFDTPNEASRFRRQYKNNNPGPHGTINIVEEFTRQKFGRALTTLRIYRGRVT